MVRNLTDKEPARKSNMREAILAAAGADPSVTCHFTLALWHSSVSSKS